MTTITYILSPKPLPRGDSLASHHSSSSIIYIITANVSVRVCVCVCFLPIHSGHQVRWTYQPGSHRRKVTQRVYTTIRLIINFSRRKRRADRAGLRPLRRIPVKEVSIDRLLNIYNTCIKTRKIDRTAGSTRCIIYP